ncbi:MAG: TrkH family potassium uptake protein [Proteobacteria bacterium]|nr:TrkH family potassium uptake protein [Pseudomonadota bacterium]
MRWNNLVNILGILIIAIGLAMIFPLLCSFYYFDHSYHAFIKSIIIALSLGLLLHGVFRKHRFDYISPREGMAVVAIGWTAIGLVGALPFYFSGYFEFFVDAFFESVSGFTTTGSSVITDIEALPRAILFWRSLIQWLGGMGIIVLSLAILPFLGVGGMQLYKAEVPSPVPDKLKPRLSETAMILWKVYALISLAQFILLWLGGMTVFDSLCHTFTTMPTGGFSTRNTSIAHYDSLYFDCVIILFMVISGINFSLHYQFLKGKPLAFWRDRECRFFIGIFLLFTALVSYDTYGSVYKTIIDAVRYSAFQVASIVTTTGYATADYELWPGMSQVILFVCMFLGASAGSTGGGVKCIRVMLCFKYCYRELFALIHPRAVSQVKMAGKTVPEDVMKSIMGFLALYMGLYVICSIALAGLGVDLVTSLTAVASCIGNVGPGFGMVGPTENFAMIPKAGKWLLIWCMLLGRLEIYTVVILLVPEFWRK